MSINFENETKNFISDIEKELNPTKFFTTKICIVNGNSKRMNIPHIVRKQFIESDKARMFFSLTTGKAYIEFSPNDSNIPPENVEQKDIRISNTGWSYFITLPSCWFRNVKPKKASLTQLDSRHSVYELRLYD